MDPIQADCIVFVDSPNEGVRDAFDDDDSADPAVEEIECVECDPQDSDEWIVSCCEEEEG